MAASVEEPLPRLTELAIPILKELLLYTDVRLQAALRRTCALFNHLLLPRAASCRDIRIFIPPRTCYHTTLKLFHAKCIEWFGYSPLRTVIIEGPYEHISQLSGFSMGLNEIEGLHLQQIIFIGQTFRDPFTLAYHMVTFCHDYLRKKNICQQLTFHDVIFSQLQNAMQEDIIGRGMNSDERKAYMLREQIIPVRGSVQVHSTSFVHDLMDLIERHCPELDEEQMDDIMQWKATCQDWRWGMRYTLRSFVARDDRPCNALYSQGWDDLGKESDELVAATRGADVRQMTKIGRAAFFYHMNQVRREEKRRSAPRETATPSSVPTAK